MQEVWRDIAGFTGLYRVSNTGKVMNTRTGKELKPYVVNGYKGVVLSKGALDKNYVKVSKLVATAFIPNPFNYKYVAHKNQDKADDNEYNIIWCEHSPTAEYDQGHAVLVSNKHGAPLSVHPSITAAAEAYDYSPQLVRQRCATNSPTRTGLYFEIFNKECR